MFKSNELKTKNACMTRRSHAGIPRLSGHKTLPFYKAGVGSSALRIAFLSRILRDMALPEAVLEELWEEYVLTQFEAPEALKEPVRMLTLMQRYLSVLLHGEPELEDVLDAIEHGDSTPYIQKQIMDAFDELPFATKRTARLNAGTMSKMVIRYLNYETRTPIFPEPKVLNLFGNEVEVRPDFVFDDGMGGIEVNRIRFCKPDVTQSGNKRDASAGNSLELYALWRYGESMVTPGEHATVTASFVFVRRADDSGKSFDPDFVTLTYTPKGAVKGIVGKNIVSLVNSTKNDGTYTGEWHEHFQALMSDFVTGIEEGGCNEEQCKTCDFNLLCHYKAGIKELPSEEKTRSVTDISLSMEQEAAVYFRDGIARINACAGAGKTLVMALFCTTLLADGADPASILCVTFTNAGASELRERVRAYVADFGLEDVDVDKIRCTTFNGFGNDIIAEHYDECGFTEPPRVVDAIERKSVIANLLRNGAEIPGLNYEQFDADMPACKGALAVVDYAFTKLKSSSSAILDAAGLASMIREECGAFILDPAAYEGMVELFYKYDDALRGRNLIEFADQENLLIELLQSNPYLLDDYGFAHIVVDEFQDSSPAQLELVRQMTECPAFKTLIIAGDDSQAIFGFRGSNPANIVEFFDRLNVPLEARNDLFISENHRSTPEILGFANALNALNKNRVVKDLIATRPSGKPVLVKGFHNTKEDNGEYPWIVEQIKQRIAEGTPPEDIAIIAATRNELLEIGGFLTEAGLESVMLAPEPMLENARVQAAIALTHALDNPNDNEEIAVYLNTLYDGKLLSMDDADVMGRIAEFADRIRCEYRSATPAAKAQFFDEALSDIDVEQEDSIFQNFRERLDRFRRQKDKLEYCSIFEQYGGEAMKRPGKYPGIVLTTAHSSKGLEWPVVFLSLTKFETKRIVKDDAVEERRRLMFVAATRARDELIITGQFAAYSKKGSDLGDKTQLIPNRFLREAHEITGTEYDPVDHEKEARKEAKKKANAKRAKRMVEPAIPLDGQIAI